jgi:HAD superfamily hydrolase (TIGR01549 family)
MKKVIIFDMDGVLIDSEPAYLEMNKSLFTELGIEMNSGEYEKFVGMDSYKMWSLIKSKYNLSQSTDELRLTEKNLMKDVLNSPAVSQTINGIPELLQLFREKKYLMSLASSSSAENIQLIVSKLNLSEYFDFIVSGEEVKNGKPAPDIFLKVSQELNVPLHYCFVIEDSSNGVKAAMSAGMHCIGFKNNGSNNQDISNADLILDSFSENERKRLSYFIESFN